MNTGETVADRITRQVEQRNGCTRGCADCAHTAGQLAATSQLNPTGRRPR